MSKKYRELGPNDFFQAGDRYSNGSRLFSIPKHFIGQSCESRLGLFPFFRPLNQSEITAAERVKFEAWVEEHAVAANMTERDQTWGYATLMVHWCWKSWCKAVGCDPKGDF